MSTFTQSLDWVNHPLVQPPFFGGQDQGNAIVTDASGNVYMTGYYSNTADLDPGPGTANLTSVGGSDIFIAKYDASGNYLWAKSVGGQFSEVGYDIALDGSGNVYITGFFENTADFDPGAGMANLTSVGSQDIFVAKYDGSGNYLWAKSMGGTESDAGYGLAVDGNGNVCVTGYFISTVDFDPGAGTANLTSLGVYEAFIAKYNTSGNYVWAKRLGGTSFDVGQGIALDAGGNVHVTGYFTNTVDFDPGAGTANLTSIGEYDIFIAKYDASGNYIWAKSVGSTSFDIGQGIALDAGGNVHVTGYFRNTADFDPGAGTANLSSMGDGDIFVAKYDALGNYLWANSMGDSESDAGYSIALSATGNVHITGFFQGTVDFDPGAGTANLTSAGGGDVFIAQYNASGIYQWAKQVGNTSNEIGYGIAVSSGGNVFVTGDFSGGADFDPGAGTATLNSGNNTTDAFALSLSSAGNYNWAINWGQYATPPSGMICLAIARDASGNVYATGYFEGENVDFDPGPGMANLASSPDYRSLFIVKYDASGNYIWAKGMVGTNSFSGDGIAVDAGGNVYVTGNFYGTADFDPGAGTANLTSSAGGADVFIAKYDASGNYLWAGNVGGQYVDLAYGIALDAGDNVCVTGFFSDVADFDPGPGVANLTSIAGSIDVFIAKYDPSGNYLWAQNIGGISEDYSFDIAVDGSNNILITGSFYQTVDFDPGAGTANLTSEGGSDIFIAKYDASGNYIWAKSMGGDNFDQGNDLVVDGSGNVYVTGQFRTTADFDPGPGTANLTSAGGDGDIFIAKYSASGNYLWAKSIGSTSTESGIGLALDGGGDVYLTGIFSGAIVDFDPGPGTANLVGAGGYDMFIAQYDASGNYLSAMSVGGPGNEAGICITAAGVGIVNVGGNFEETVDFDPGAGTAEQSAIAIGGDIFIAQYNFGAAGFTDCPAAPILVNTDPGQCSALVSYTVTASGMPTLTYSFSGATVGAGAGTGSGSTFNTGLTTVTVSAAGATCVFTITVTDNEAPTANCPAPTTVNCAGNVPVPNPASVGGTDNCGIVNKVHMITSAPYDVSCINRFKVMRFYRVFDAAGNSASCSQVITVFDNVKPVFTFVPANVTVQCNSIPAVGSPTASDGCGGSVSVAYDGQTVSNILCTDKYTLTRKWIATDACGNTQTATQRITVIDSQKPNFTSTPANVTVQCNAVPAPASPTATDNCDAAVAITYNGQTQTNGACPNAYTLTRTWTAADNCGNTKTVTQRITVVDNIKPVFTSIPADDNISCADPIPPVGTPTASDACEGSVTIAYLGQTTTGSSCPGNYQITRTWRATDACGNSTAATQTIQVSDGGAPVFTSTPGPLTIECGDPLPPLVNPTASDACVGYVAVTFLGNVPSGSGCAQDYTVTRTWEAEDLCGNTATTSQVITVQGNSYGEEGAENRNEDATGLITHRSSLIVTPNPTTDRIWLDLTDFADQAVTVTIFDDLGRVVWERRIPTVEDLKLQISLLEAGAKTGIYTVSVRGARGVAATRVVLVE